MHISPADFRVVRRGPVIVEFAAATDVAYVVAEFPMTGSAGTFAEDPCDRAHWGFNVAGDVAVEVAGETHELPAGTAFHLPSGLAHRFQISGAARLAGFERLEPGAPRSDDELRRAGWDVVRPARRGGGPRFSVARPEPLLVPDPGEIIASARRMGDLLFMRTQMGRRAGYTAARCDLPHWGLVTSGSLAIEWEDDIEVLTAGDAFWCPAGPPAHRLQAAEPATVVDFTPIDALDRADRIPEWRQAAIDRALAHLGGGPRLEVAALL
jgi:quercetin dioxygenase-like cupin family protein